MPEENQPTETTKKELEAVSNCWTIYTDDSPTAEVKALAEIGRPQDWGDPRWMYRVYTLEAQGYRHTVHCWYEGQIEEYEHLKVFAQFICMIMLPGYPEWRSGRDFLHEDDFWLEEWGAMPDYREDDDDDYAEYEY